MLQRRKVLDLRLQKVVFGGPSTVREGDDRLVRYGKVRLVLFVISNNMI